MKAHGLEGGVWVKPFDSAAGRGRGLKEVVLMRGPEKAPARIRSVREANGRWIVSFEGIRTREEAEGLRGWLIGVPEGEASPLPEGTFYVHDIIGREVVTEDGELLGLVTNVISTGSNDVYIIESLEGELMFPALRELILECPPDTRTMKVRLLPGLLEACFEKRAS
jgi:16S rRNA processing protein RimM